MYNLPFWLAVGFIGQVFFTARFLVQWWVSEKKQDSVVPIAFWWLSLVGGVTLLAYAISRRDPVIISGQAMGVFVYLRNLMLAGKGKAERVRNTIESSGVILHPPCHPRAALKTLQAAID